ncbi:MAG: type II toxin-antitoxin system Phd/YefM family antitoxin [Candidatus Omnitrophota bacterium]|nr:type II toxin-antitoxin system Phd/YefM family antitoxin [Candidatus Omnitrophota bacterium]
MYTVKEETTLVGVSELRTKLEKILEEAKHHKVVIEKRNKPVAVLIAIERYNEIEEILDMVEDLEFGRIAHERAGRASPKDYISIEKAFRKAA